MLTHLSVRNVVLIDKLDLDFTAGLTVFTGETGAGKSILLDSLSLALGERADAGLVRHGTNEAIVTASFSVPLSHAIGVLLAEHGMAFEGEVILRRVVSADGRSRAFINDEPVSVGFLKSIGDLLVEIHGQFASHKLLNPATHLETLDAYGALAGEGTACRRAFQQWQYKKNERNQAEQALMKAQKEEEFVRASVTDLEKLAPMPDEEEQLSQKRAALMNSEKIVSALNTAYALLSDEEAGCETRLGQVLLQLEHANDWSDNALAGLADQVSQAIATLQDVEGALEHNRENWGDVSELPAIDDRLFALRDMARKHQVSIAELPELLVKLKEQLTRLEIGETAIVNLQKEEETARLAYIACAEKLSDRRHKSAEKLDKAVMKELAPLKLNKATFITEIEKLPEAEWTATGMDRVAFLVSTNKGTPPAPIHKVASGGELARFMLALKVNLATADEAETLVFDEVDSGVGGATAAAVGERLRQLAGTHQVLVVTHSPQVAAYGQVHMTVSKEESESQMLTRVRGLTDLDKTDEIARMLSGACITAAARTMAKELVESCSKK